MQRPETANRQGTTDLTVLEPSSEGQGDPKLLCFQANVGTCAHWELLRPEANKVAGYAERFPEGNKDRQAPYSKVEIVSPRRGLPSEA